MPGSAQEAVSSGGAHTLCPPRSFDWRRARSALTIKFCTRQRWRLAPLTSGDAPRRLLRVGGCAQKRRVCPEAPKRQLRVVAGSGQVSQTCLCASGGLFCKVFILCKKNKDPHLRTGGKLASAPPSAQTNISIPPKKGKPRPIIPKCWDDRTRLRTPRSLVRVCVCVVIVVCACVCVCVCVCVFTWE